MPAVPDKAVLEVSDITRFISVAKAAGPMPFALAAWLYEFGARAAEPGLQRLRDVDLRAARARPRHLKDGKEPEWFALLPFCREALPLWLATRPTFVSCTEQTDYLFPSEVPGRCYTCKGTGKRPVLRRVENGGRKIDGTTACHHCGETGERWGISRNEVYLIVSSLLKSIGLGQGHYHPHVLRHSICTHLLEAGVPPGVIQQRVGHKSLTTTLGYVGGTRAAAAEIEGRMKALYGSGDD